MLLHKLSFLSERSVLLLSRCKITGNKFTQKQNYYPGNRKTFNTNNEEISKSSITYFLRQHNIQFQEGPTCIRCKNPFLRDKDPTCYINLENGFFSSTNSNHKGSWEDFKEAVSGDKEFSNTGNLNLKDLLKEVDEEWRKTIKFQDIPAKKIKQITNKLEINCIPLHELKKHDIRLSTDYESLLIPWYEDLSKKTLLGLKKISIQPDEKTEICLPHDEYYHIFGLNEVIKSQQVILTSSIIDTLMINSLKQNIKAVCLPYGSTRLPLEVLPYFERFKQLIIWLDIFEWQDALRMANKFGISRCKVIRPNNNIPNPLTAILNGENVSEIAASSVPAEIKNIVSYKDLSSLVKTEILNHEKFCGIKWNRFPKLTQMLKGHRRGELTILTGPSGCGKTTFLCEYSLDLAISGVSTLWGSFEISNPRLLKTLLSQYAKQKIVDIEMDNFEKVSADFKKLPINLMTYSGNNNVKEVLNTMKQGAYMYDVSHIILDNLQFMLGDGSSMIERFNAQDNAITQFRRFATKENIHITLVIHPRKEDAYLPLQMSSVFGGAKATQEADNVFILQCFEQPGSLSGNIRQRYLEIVKNRFNGELGKVQMHFNKNSLCMSEPSPLKQTKSKSPETPVLHPVESAHAIKM